MDNRIKENKVIMRPNLSITSLDEGTKAEQIEMTPKDIACLGFKK
jgi:hypothetical protein